MVEDSTDRWEWGPFSYGEGGWATGDSQQGQKGLVQVLDDIGHDVAWSDVAANRSQYKPEQGARFFATDTGKWSVGNGNSWEVVSPSDADHTVRTTAELESAFNNLGHGDTVYITDENAPYRTTQWLDIDHDYVTVTGRRSHLNLIKPADGANVGGIRVGLNPVNGSVVQDVTIAGVSYHGNTNNQTASSGLFGFSLESTKDCTVRDCYITRTHPYHEHNQNNSGMMIRDSSESYTLRNNTIQDPGDRCITADGRNGIITENHLREGFDRAIALAGAGGDAADHMIVADNVIHDMSEGSAIGMSGKNYADMNLITGNHITGVHRSGVRIGRQSASGDTTDIDADIYIVGNYMNPDGQSLDPGGSYGAAGVLLKDPYRDTDETTGSVNVRGNMIAGYTTAGIEVNTPHANIQNNTIRGCSKQGIITHDAGNNAVIQGNILAGNASSSSTTYAATIDIATTGCTVRDNVVRQTSATNCIRTDTTNGGGNTLYRDNETPSGATAFGTLASDDVVRGHSPRFMADVRNFSPPKGTEMYHDPSVSGDTNTEGPAFYNGSAWTSLVDGSTIS